MQKSASVPEKMVFVDRSTKKTVVDLLFLVEVYFLQDQLGYSLFVQVLQGHTFRAFSLVIFSLSKEKDRMFFVPEKLITISCRFRKGEKRSRG